MKKSTSVVFLLSLLFASCSLGPKGEITVYSVKYSIEHSKAPYDVYFYVDLYYYGEDNDLEVTWDFGDGTTSNVLQAVHTYYEDKSYSVTLTLKNFQTTEIQKLEIDLTLPHTPAARFGWAAANDNNNMYAPAEVQFYNYSMFADSYFWNFGDGRGSDQAEPYHTYQDPGMYNVTLTVYSGQDTVKETRTIEIR